MKKLHYILPLFLIVITLLSGCAQTSSYNDYEGGGIVSGSGGTKKTHDGIDIWMHGTPPRKYKVVGIMETWGAVQGPIKKAKEKGADAIVLRKVDKTYTGSSYNPTFGSTSASYRQDQTWEIVKYVK